MDQPIRPNAVGAHFLDCLARAERRDWPYRYWLLDDALPTATLDAIVALPFAPPAAAVFDGRREANNSTRIYFSRENEARFPVCRELADALVHPTVTGAIERMTGTDLGHGRLRIEYCQDADGFWLEPHVDIPVKLFTMLIYLSGEPGLRDAGTDIYDGPEGRRVATAPHERNRGLIFIPGRDTWHGFTRRPIRGVRRSIIVNYVSPEWRAVAELA